jgi:hypothetical protein
MRRLALVALVLVAGCGGGGGGRAANSAAPTPSGPCPEGTGFLRARDVIGPTPAGFEVVAGDRKAIDTLIAPLREGLAERWRGYDAKVLIRPRAQYGTAVIVVNTHERRAETMRGFLAAERAAGKEGETVEVAGESGRLLPTADGSSFAIAPAGECSLVFLVADREERVRTALSVIGRR